MDRLDAATRVGDFLLASPDRRLHAVFLPGRRRCGGFSATGGAAAATAFGALGWWRFRLPLSPDLGAAVLQRQLWRAQAVVFGGLFFLSVMPDWLGVIIGVLAGFWVLATFGVFVEGGSGGPAISCLSDEAYEIRGGRSTAHSLVAEADPDFCRLDEHAPGETGTFWKLIRRCASVARPRRSAMNPAKIDHCARSPRRRKVQPAARQ